MGVTWKMTIHGCVAALLFVGAFLVGLTNQLPLLV